VITSVDRDDLRDGGAGHFVECIRRIRELSPQDPASRCWCPISAARRPRARDPQERAAGRDEPHLETAARLYKQARPGSDYQFSLNLLKKFKALHPDVPTKSGIMVGLGETDEEILEIMRRHARARHRHDHDRPIPGAVGPPPCPWRATCNPDTFRMFEQKAIEMGFSHAAVGAMGALQLPRGQAVAEHAGLDMGSAN